MSQHMLKLWPSRQSAALFGSADLPEQESAAFAGYSHSMVPGGFDVMS